MKLYHRSVQRTLDSKREIQRRLLVLFFLGNFSAGNVLADSTIAVGTAEPAVAPEFVFSDDFERSNADTLGPQWTDCNSVTPDSYDPLGIYDGGVVISDPFTRPGNYGAPPLINPAKEGELFPGIGCAFIDTGSTSVSVKIVWSGNHGIESGMPYSHVEATPLLYITPSNPRFGFGTWISELWGQPVVLVGYIVSPPEAFEIIATAVLPAHESGTPRELELRADEPGKVTMWLDGEQIMFNPGGVPSVSVDPTMIESTLHGIAVDAHIVAPQSNIPTIKGIETVTIRNLD
ncbi:Uncharacterised protein [Halioglobus japonicus]|nr:Uncharacterised protein [Halioglobus japonicus]